MGIVRHLRLRAEMLRAQDPLHDSRKGKKGTHQQLFDAVHATIGSDRAETRRRIDKLQNKTFGSTLRSFQKQVLEDVHSVIEKRLEPLEQQFATLASQQERAMVAAQALLSQLECGRRGDDT